MKTKSVLVIILSLFILICNGQVKLYVSPKGNNNNAGTITKPFKSPETAITKALTYTGKEVIIEIRGGAYRLEKTIQINSSDYSLRSLTIKPCANEKVIISGAKIIYPKWKPYKNGILQSYLDLSETLDRLFLNGKNLVMARYPNYDSSARVFNGTSADAISPERIKTWKNPQGGYIHALHNGEWGDFHYCITGKTAEDKLNYEGGWQNNRPAPMHKQHRFVENIFEELDAPGEWFYDRNTKIIYLHPPKETSVHNAQFEVSNLTDLICITGDSSVPVENITIKNIHFTHNNRSFMLTKEPLLRSDWCIYRGGAVVLTSTNNINISNCTFSDLGGNAVFVDGYNNNTIISDNHFYNIGASAVAFVGSADAVRSPAFRYQWFVPWNEMDYTPKSKTNNYPQHCIARGNLIHNIGSIEKQVAAVQISMAAHIQVSYNTIYNVPRAGINIGDGCWGGHTIEYNDVFNTVMETGDHGAFNSWGRDRFWRPNRSITDSIVAAKQGIELLDAMEPIIIRNNRFHCDHGWDIDLDDGSSNYYIYNNVCLSGGLKLREGYHRIVANNIIINNTFHPHVWYKKSNDVFIHNIVTTPYAPIGIDSWGKKVDNNFFLTKTGLTQSNSLGIDKNSSWGNPMFVDAQKGDYRVKQESPALQTGFKNFAMDFGVTKQALRKIAATPTIRPLLVATEITKGMQTEWLGGKFKNIETPGERSAVGLPDNNGALLIEIPAKSIIAKSNLQKGDVIIELNGTAINSTNDLLSVYQGNKWMGGSEAIIIRNQAKQKINILFK